LLTHGSEISFDTILVNNVNCDLRIFHIQGPIVVADAPELPCIVGPGEIFSVPGLIKDSNALPVSIWYDAECLPRSNYSLALPPVTVVEQLLVFTLDAPATAVRYSNVTVTVTVERSPKHDETQEVLFLALEVAMVPGFFTKGPARMLLSVMRGQKIEARLTFLPLDAGATTLPPIVITDPGLAEIPVKRFHHPIIVTYQ
jgi:hypothetical protein